MGIVGLYSTGYGEILKVDESLVAQYVALGWLPIGGGGGGVTDSAVAQQVTSGAQTKGALDAAYAATLLTATTATSSATLAPDKHTPVDATSGALTMTLPTPTRIGQQIRVEKVDSSANVVTVTGTLRGVTSSVPMPFQYEVRTFIAESLSSWRVASGNTPKTALDATYGKIAVNRPASYNEGGPAIPAITKAGVTVVTKTASGLRSIYNPSLVRVPESVRAANPSLGRWRLYYSTDHDSSTGQIGMSYCAADALDDPAATWTVWTDGASSPVMFTEGGSSQTETPWVVWNPRTSLFHMYYQVQSGSTQRTKVATSPDGIAWTIVGVAFPNPPSTVAGYNHTGYARVWLVDGLWVAYTLVGGATATSAEGVWYSYDGLTFLRDPRRLRGGLHWSEGTLRTAPQGLLHWRGQWWATATSVDFVSGANISSVSQNWLAPLNPDFRTLRGRPQYVPFAPEGGEALGLPGMWAAAPDGRLWGAYRAGDKNSSFRLAVLS